MYDKFYLPIKEEIVDFSGINSFNRDFLEKSISENKIKITMKFTQKGFYYFIVKLTIHSLRMESLKVERNEL